MFDNFVWFFYFYASHAPRWCPSVINSQVRGLDTVNIILGRSPLPSTSGPILFSNIFCESSRQNYNVGVIS